MEIIVETKVEGIINSLSDYTLVDKGRLLMAIADKLYDYAVDELNTELMELTKQ
jgi:multidrug resistance efflux pump